MDISKETNPEKLKALAYDCLLVIETQQANLRLIQQRLAEIENIKPKS